MTERQTMIAALRDAIAQGARHVTFHSGGTRREVEYHSLSEMIEALKWLEGQEAAANGRSRITIAAF